MRTTPTLALVAMLTLLPACMDPGATDRLVPATVIEDDTLPSLQLSDTLVHLETFGDPEDPVVIVLHGGPGDDYRYMLRLLEPLGGPSIADDHFVVLWDQRGTGLSERHDAEDLTLATYLRDLEEVIDAFASDRRVILLGHSWGGQYAAMYMNAHPERVAGVILGEPGRLRWDLEELEDDFSFDYTAEHLGDLLWVRQLFSMGDHARADYVVSTMLLEQTNGRIEEPSPAWRVGALVIFTLYLEQLETTRWDFTARLREVEPEVLFIAGELSVGLGAEFQQRQQQLFSRSRLVVIEDAGHSDIVYSRAEATVPVIREYLAKLPREGGRG